MLQMKKRSNFNPVTHLQVYDNEVQSCALDERALWYRIIRTSGNLEDEAMLSRFAIPAKQSTLTSLFEMICQMVTSTYLNEYDILSSSHS